MTNTTGYDGMWLPIADDPRTQGNPQGELATYREYLGNYRATLRLKCDGLSPQQLATQSVPPSNLSLLGLIRHMARVENAWFTWFLQGRWDVPRLYKTPQEPDLDFTGATGTQDCVADAFAGWEREIAEAERWLDGLTEERLGEELPFPPSADGAEPERASIRDVLLHMVEEYARHAGHADLLRECIDGRTGQ
ncbi:DinB family protein [Flexivirga sp.]|uniref:DinB family protein n=1 Tax=Flexivirga sp. TaxID=1962927 RepID=UPI003F8049CE